MIDFHLPIFPPGGLASSVTTTVWIGIFVTAFFNLRFGWTFSGLVVPGYLVPLLIIKPWSAFVVVQEAAITYFIVVWMFRYLARTGLWTPVFGRDRFFAILIVSVMVRIAMDGWLLPLAGEYLVEKYGFAFDYRNNLHSFGLIIVALIANQFWKPGFFRGMIPFCTTLLVTFAIVRYLLMPFTNFSISNLAYLYEDFAASMLASPKAYIILLTAAFMASRMNLNYGWEYSGILIPSLIALLWHEPLKIAVSFAETFVILGLAALALRLPVFRKTTIEGARKILLFFNISYAYKFALAYVLLWLAPEVKITDYYGFGYLLTSLLAVKMYDKDIAAKVTRATFQTSLAAAVVAGLIGFSLSLISRPTADAVAPVGAAASPPVISAEATPSEIVEREKITLYESRMLSGAVVPLPSEVEIFSRALERIREGGSSLAVSGLSEINDLLYAVNYRASLYGGRYLVLSELEPARDWGIYLLDLSRSGHRALTVEVPSPLASLGLAEAGAGLFELMDGRTLALGGAVRTDPNTSSSAPLSNSPRSFFQTFHKVFGGNNVVQIHGIMKKQLRALRAGRSPDDAERFPSNSLWVKSRLPEGLRVGTLKNLTGDLDIQWKAPPGKNLQRETSRSGFAELFLNEQARRSISLASRHSFPAAGGKQAADVSGPMVQGYIRERILSEKERLAGRGSEKYKAPKLGELLFFDREVLSPLIRVSFERIPDAPWTGEQLEELETIRSSARVMGFDLVRFSQANGKKEYLILSEPENSPDRRFLGFIVFDPSANSEFLVEIPYPISDLNVLEYGAGLFERMGARCLFFAAAHRDANFDRSADLLQRENKSNLLNLTRQVLFREFADAPMLAVQIRAAGIQPGQPFFREDALLHFSDGVVEPGRLSARGRFLLDFLEKENMSIRFVDGSPETAGYEAGGLVPLWSLAAAKNKEYALLWLSPETRRSYRRQDLDFREQSQFAGIGLPSAEKYLREYLSDPTAWETEQIPGMERLVSRLAEYADSPDIVLLRQIVAENPELAFERCVDLESRRSFLLVFSPSKKLSMAADLSSADPNSALRAGSGENLGKVVSGFLDAGAGFLLWDFKAERGETARQ